MTYEDIKKMFLFHFEEPEKSMKSIKVNCNTFYGGGQAVINEHVTHLIKWEVTSQPEISALALKEEFALNASECKTSTIETMINWFEKYFSKKCLMISNVNCKKKLGFAKLYLNKPDSFWDTILWSVSPNLNS